MTVEPGAHTVVDYAKQPDSQPIPLAMRAPGRAAVAQRPARKLGSGETGGAVAESSGESSGRRVEMPGSTVPARVEADESGPGEGEPTRVEFAEYGGREADCPARLAVDLFGNSWLTVIVYTLRDGPMRPVDLRREIGTISQKMLTQTLRRMETMGLVERRRYAEAPPRVEYGLTRAGIDLLVPIFALGEWVDEHGELVRNSLYRDETD